MPGTSDGTHVEPMDESETDLEKKGSKRKFDEEDIMESIKHLSQDQIKHIIGTAKKTSKDSGNIKSNPQQPPTKSTTSSSTKNNINNDNQQLGNKNTLPNTEIAIAIKRKNFYTQMNEITNKKFINLFYVNTETAVNTRIQMAEIWHSVRPNNTDVILKTKKGFLLKSDTAKVILVNTLKTLQKHKKITTFSETTAYNNSKPNNSSPAQTYSCVIASVEQEITDTQMSQHLKNLNIEHRYCKRIISKTTDKPTLLVRIITGEVSSYEKLLNEGVFYKCRHYAVYPSTPPPPAPLPCNKCLMFTHKTEECNTPLKCHKCGDNHATTKCKSELPPKCNSCESTEHQAWSFKCPNRPLKPIEGIPNIPVKTLNKKSHEITNSDKKNSRIHSPITIHDTIINTFINKLNKPENNNREEITEKLRKRFRLEYNVETSITFVGNNRIYILMFDMEENDFRSPTETIPGNNNSQIHVSV